MLRAALSFVLLASPVAARAQAPDPIRPGDRIQVTYEEWARVVLAPCPGAEERQVTGGLLVAADHDSVSVRVAGCDTPATIARGSIDEVWVKRGRRGNAPAGFLVGALVGGAATVIATASCGGDWMSGCVPGGLAFVGGALAGGLLGAVIGNSVQSDRWVRAPLYDARLVVTPRGGGLGVGLGLTF